MPASWAADLRAYEASRRGPRAPQPAPPQPARSQHLSSVPAVLASTADRTALLNAARDAQLELRDFNILNGKSLRPPGAEAGARRQPTPRHARSFDIVVRCLVSASARLALR